MVIKIAICDDECTFLDRIEEMLRVYEKRENQCFMIKRYTKPLQLMDSLKEDFQVFFLDMQMPNMDGFELANIVDYLKIRPKILISLCIFSVLQ